MKKKVFFICVSTILLAGLVWLIWGNITVGLSEYEIYESDLPAAFDGYRIAHVSDLHNSGLWEKTIVKLQACQPDIICITGDLIDCKKTDVDTALAFAAEAVRIAPCYYITGNHEINVTAAVREELIRGLKTLGVTVLMDDQILLEKDGQSIALVGHKWGNSDAVGELTDFDGYRILLSHRPECFDDYAAGEYDLVLTGHAHGGQVRLPWIGGLYAPGQGIFPEYDSGVYTEGRTDMVVSRGIGNSGFPIRFSNRPEVIVVTLRVDTFNSWSYNR
ncbi:MAG: metallophosphoesterase [Ruminococcaceae bacterium]|nr:metallophosphoesterase [Oscillospiraceae bacterium]